MRNITLTIKTPHSHICSNFIPGICEGGFVVEVLRCVARGKNYGHALIRIHAPSLVDEVTMRGIILEKSNLKLESEITCIQPGTFLVLVANKSCAMCNIIAESGCFIELSTLIKDDTMVWNILSPDSESVNILIGRLKALGCTVSDIQTRDISLRTGITYKQMQALKIAYDHGYYDVPRRIGLDDLAYIIGCSKSTLDLLLRRAQHGVLSQFLTKTSK
jgi:HTH-type transcriptional regulator, dimethyl sulfoxide reductase transcription regulator